MDTDSSFQSAQQVEAPQIPPNFARPPVPLVNITPTLTPLKPTLYYPNSRLELSLNYEINNFYQRRKGPAPHSRPTEHQSEEDDKSQTAPSLISPQSLSSHVTPDLVPSSSDMRAIRGEYHSPWQQLSFNTLFPTSDVRSEQIPAAKDIPLIHSTLPTRVKRRKYTSSRDSKGD